MRLLLEKKRVMSILILDVGSSSMRGILYGLGGTILDESQVKYAPLFSEGGMIAEQDPVDFKSALWQILSWAGNDPSREDIDAICLTSQRSSCICVDAEGTPIGNAICWQDKRTIPIIKELEKYGEKVEQLSGAWPNPVFLGPKLTWIRRERPDVYKNIWKFMTIADYLMFLMTGLAVTDDTYGSRTHLMNIETGKWDDKLLEIFEVEREKLCDIVPVGSLVGPLCEEAARATGLCAGVRVYTAGGDQQCALIGQGSFDGKTVSVTLGTGAFVGTNLDELPVSRTNGIIYNASAISKGYVAEYSSVTCTAALDWLLREMYWNMPADHIGSELAKTRAGAGGCLVLPYFQGRVTPDHNSNAKAVFAGISLSTRKEDMLRALIEAIAMEVRTGVENIAVDAAEICISGGLSKTPEVCQIIADVLGRRVLINNESDATAFGAFVVAGTGLGFFKSVRQGYESLRGKKSMMEFIPRSENAGIYDELYRKNLSLYEKVKTEF